MASRGLRIIYRSNSHAPLWLVADKSGCWNKNGLAVDTSPQLVWEKAVESPKNGHVDLISGNHHNLYARNAKNGEDFVHLAQPGHAFCPGTRRLRLHRSTVSMTRVVRGRQPRAAGMRNPTPAAPGHRSSCA